MTTDNETPARRADGTVPAVVGNCEIPLTGRELLTALRDGRPVQVERGFLSKALLLVEQCAEACIDVRTDGDKAVLTPELFRLTETGEKAIANSTLHRGEPTNQGENHGNQL